MKTPKKGLAPIILTYADLSTQVDAQLEGVEASLKRIRSLLEERERLLEANDQNESKRCHDKN